MRRLPVVSGGMIGFRFRRVLVALVVLGTFTVSCGDTDIAAFGPPTSVRATSTSVATTSTSTASTTVAITTPRPETITSTTTVAATTTALPPETTPTTTTTLVLEYSVDRAVDYIGTSATLYTIGSFQELGGEKYFHNWYGPQADNGSWTLNVFRRYPEGGTRTDADLVILVDETSKTVVDALLLAGESAGRDVWIGLSCFSSKPAVLVDRNAKPARAWKVSADPLRLTEVDTSELTGEEIDSACANLPVHLR